MRRLLTKAEERLSGDGRNNPLGLPGPSVPAGYVATTWQSKELIRSLYEHENEALALAFITRLSQDFNKASPPQGAQPRAHVAPMEVPDRCLASSPRHQRID